MAGANKEKLIEDILDQFTDPDATPETDDPAHEPPPKEPSVPPSDAGSSQPSPDEERIRLTEQCWMAAVRIAEQLKPYSEYRNRYVEPRIYTENGKIVYGAMLVQYHKDLWVLRREDVQWLSRLELDLYPELRT